MENWSGKQVAFIGDSITQGVGSEKAYHQYLAEWLGLEALNYGVNGAQIADMITLEHRLKVEHPNVGAVFLLGGTNDYNHGVPIGEFYRESREKVNHNGAMVMRLHRQYLFDEHTFCGRLNILLRQLKIDFPRSQVVLMTPIHRGFASFGTDNVQPDELWANAQDLYIDDYVRTLRHAADLWSLPLIDLFRNSGLLPILDEYAGDFHDPTTDRLHPNAAGHLRIARGIMAKMNEIAVWKA